MAAQNKQAAQPAQPAGLFDGIQNEVSAENAPLLNFITRYAGVIATVLILFLAILAGMGIWNWRSGNQQKEAREDLVKIMGLEDASQKEKALEELAKRAPDSVRMYVLLTLGQVAYQNNNLPLAARAYEEAAALDKNSALGLSAALGSVSALLAQGDARQAVAMLQRIETEIPGAVNSLRLKEILAEAAFKARDLPLAISTYEWLAQQTQAPEKDYFLSRIDALKAEK